MLRSRDDMSISSAESDNSAMIWQHENVYMATEGARSQQKCGVPAIHRGTVAESPCNLWLVDSGATAHMTPYTLSDPLMIHTSMESESVM
jgi:hypothetical protein